MLGGMRTLVVGAALLAGADAFCAVSVNCAPRAGAMTTCAATLAQTSSPLSRRKAVVAAGLGLGLAPARAGASKQKKASNEAVPVADKRKSAAQEFATAMMAKNERSLALMLDEAVTLQSERGSASSREEVVAKLKAGYSGFGNVSDRGLTAKCGAKTYNVLLEFDSGVGGLTCWPASDARCERKLRITRISEVAK